MFANQYFVNYISGNWSPITVHLKVVKKKKKLKFGSYTGGRNIQKQTKLDSLWTPVTYYHRQKSTWAHYFCLVSFFFLCKTKAYSYSSFRSSCISCMLSFTLSTISFSNISETWLFLRLSFILLPLVYFNLLTSHAYLIWLLTNQ